MMPNNPAHPPRRPRLLVVDDEPINIRTLYQIFAADHEVFSATSGWKALEHCGLIPPDLILLDVMMPEMDGIEVCRRVKTDPATANIPILFVTAQHEPAEETRALEAGGVDFITKPFNAAVIRARVRTHLALRAQTHLLQRVTAQVPGMVYQFLLRPDGTSAFPYASNGIRDIYRVAPEAVSGDATAVFTVLHPDDYPAVVASIQESARSGQPWRHRYRVRFSDGDIRWLQSNAMPRHEPDGGCLWHGFITDVTADVAVEEKLRLAASVFAHSQEGILITDAGGFIVDVNPGFSRITGYGRDEVLGRSPRMLGSGHQDAAFYGKMWKALHETGAWRGEIWNRNKSGEVYPELLSISEVKDGTGQISHYIGTFSDITHLKEREIQLERIAHYDPLTNLPNRRLLGDRLRQALAHTRRDGKIMAVCLLDLDHFKPINDSLGHEAGDRVLIEISRRLSACVREQDTVARLGGDEFVLLLNLAWVEECDAILTRMLCALEVPVDLNGSSASLSASIGVTLFPQDESDAEQLLNHADQAMYRAKQAGRNSYRLFDAEHDRLVREHRRLLEDLAEALNREQFILYYQPKVEMTTGQVVGAEALIRWCHPERGLLSPAEFLYAMEGTALEIPLGEWVLSRAIQQLAVWKTQGLRLTLSVNLGVRQLHQPGLVEHLAAILARHPEVSGPDLAIEILESSAMAHDPQITAAVNACQALGVRVALDDFGTGHSSLANFRRQSFDILKIDQTLVRDMIEDPEDMAIVEGVIKIAEAFGRELVAEGVETVEQGIWLIYLGCRLAQGYAIARPMPADSLPTWIKTWPGEPSWRLMTIIPLEREDLALVVAGNSHRQWVDRLITYLETEPEPGDLPWPFDNTMCPFGRWLQGQERARYEPLAEFVRIESLHKRFHALADEMIGQHAVDVVGARARIDDIRVLRDQIAEAIVGLLSSKWVGK